MSGEKGKVSIALCTYNGEQFIRKQIESYLNQTVLPDEIIVSDDGSGDGTLTIVQQYAETNPGMDWFLIRNEIRLGTSKNFEKAIARCRGEFIFLSDQDDIWERDKIEQTLIFFDKNPDCEGSFSNASLMDDSDQELPETLLDHSFFKVPARNKYKKDDLLYWSILMGNLITGATMAIRRTALGIILPFHLNLGRKLWHDGWIGFSLMTSNQIGYIDQTLMRYRIHAAQQVGVVIKKDPFEELVMLREYREDQTKEYFQRYLSAYSAMQMLKKVRPVAIEIDQRITSEYLAQMKKYFESQAFLVRKFRLLKWYLRGMNHISFRDLMTL